MWKKIEAIKFNYSDYDYYQKMSVAQCFNSLVKMGGSIYGEPGYQFAFLGYTSNKVLAVVHCDTVQQGVKGGVVHLDNETLIFNPRLDDRLGLYTILHVLPKMGINVDILLTDHEEEGHSTADIFSIEKQYNWIVEFDRRGKDVALYDYDEGELGHKWKDKIKEFFPDIVSGSLTDICKLYSMKCCAMNVGVGYHDEHHTRCFMVLEEYYEMIKRFANFFKHNVDVYYPFDEGKINSWANSFVTTDEIPDYIFPLIEDLGMLSEFELQEYENWTVVFCPSCKEPFFDVLADYIEGELYCPFCGSSIPIGSVSSLTIRQANRMVKELALLKDPIDLKPNEFDLSPELDMPQPLYDDNEIEDNKLRLLTCETCDKNFGDDCFRCPYYGEMMQRLYPF